MFEAIGNLVGAGFKFAKKRTKGTSSCGARPIFKGGARNKYNDCIAKSQDVAQDMAQEKEVTKRTMFIVVGSIVVVAVVIALVLKK